MSETLTTIGVGLAMLIGLAGIFIPVLPDLILIWAGALVYGLVLGWGRWGVGGFAAISVLALAGLLAEGWVGGAGARRGGGSLFGILGGFALGIVGLIFGGPLGLIAGLLVGTFLVELLRGGDARQALKATVGMGVGYGVSFFVKLAIGLGMIAIWVIGMVLG